MENKKETLRKKFKIIRESISNREEKSIKASKNVLSLPDIIRAKSIAVFSSFSTEINTEYLINSLIATHNIALPVVINRSMYFIKISPQENMHLSKYGILEPQYNSKNIMHDIDIAIVPGLAFSKYGARLGYGGGYYDRYFANKPTMLCGLCFDEQIIDSLVHDNLDKKMNIIVSDKRIIKIK